MSFPGLKYILGARLRSDHEVRDMVLGWPGRYHEVHGPRKHSKDPFAAEGEGRAVHGRGWPGPAVRGLPQCGTGREGPARSGGDRGGLGGPTASTGPSRWWATRGIASTCRCEGEAAFGIDQAKVKEEARFDGKWVLRSNWDQASAEELALRYKDLWMVEAIFRAAKTILETRPIYHKCDETIRGHVFCSFLALVLMKELEDRLAAKGLGAGMGGRAAGPGGVAGDAAGQRGGDLRVAEHAAGRGREGAAGGGRGVGPVATVPGGDMSMRRTCAEGEVSCHSLLPNS